MPVESQAQYHQVLGPSIRSPRALQHVFRCLHEVIVAELSREATRTRQGATSIAKTITQMMKAVVHYVAKTPSVAGDVRGVSLENAKMYATKTRDQLLDISRANGAPHTASYLNSPIGWKTLSLSTTSYIDIVSGLADLENERGQITSEAIATAMPMKAQYYPEALATVLGEIQARYDALPIPETARQVLGPILAGGHLATAPAVMNGIFGHFQCAVPIIRASVIELPAEMYRRDLRQVLDREGRPVPFEGRVIPFATHPMRAALASALEMSIELGDVLRHTSRGVGTGAGPKTSFKVRYGTPFAHLIELAIETKRYYNPAGPKDLVQYISDTKQASIDIYSDTIAWKSLKRNDEGNHYDFSTASLVLEVETRLRISEYNNEDVLGPRGSRPAKPSSKEVKVPNFTYFMKAPRELIEAVPVAAAAHSFDEFKADANLRQDTARRFKSMLDQVHGDYRQFQKQIANLAREIGEACERIILVHHARALAESTRLASTAKAKFVKLPRT